MNLQKIMESKKKAKLRAYQNHVLKFKKKQDWIERLQLIKLGNRKLNSLRWYSGETKEHILKKLDICMDLKSQGHNFVTEAIFNNGSRADIVDLTTGEIYEILVTETDEKFEKKIINYPEEFKIIKIT